MTVEEFGERLLALRDERGLPGTEVARMAGIDPGTYYAIENGKRKPRGATERRLARAFGMSLEEFKAALSGDGPGKGGSRSQLEAGRKLADRLERLVADAERRGERSDVLWGDWWTAAQRAAFTSDQLGFEGLAERFRATHARALRNYEELHGGIEAHGEEFDRLLKRLDRETIEANA